MSSESKKAWRAALRYGICAMSCSMLHSLFTSFYVDYFVRGQLQRMSKSGTATETLAIFATGQFAYALWNGLNDIGFGWCGDLYFSQLNRRRFRRILIGGPLWALVFALLWHPAGFAVLPQSLHPAIQFSLMMMLYDGFFSYTTVAFRALLTDISTGPRTRELCNASAAVFHVLGSVGVGMASYLYEGDNRAPVQHEGKDLTSFRWFTTLWAVVAAVGFIIAASGGREITLKQRESASNADSERSKLHHTPAPTVLGFAREAVRRRSLVVAMVVWSVQEYSCTFATNFFGMFLALVCGDTMSVGMRSSLLLLSFVVPHLVTLAVTPLLPTVGKKRLIGALFWSRALVGVAMLLLAQSIAAEGHQTYVFAALLLLNRILTEAVCRLQALVLSDIVDEDTVTCHRPHSLAASVNGLVSLVSKPCQSIAPVVTCYYLSSKGILLQSTVPPPLANGSNDASNVRAVISSLVGGTALLTAGAMWVVWRAFYTLDGAYLSHIQREMKLRNDVKLEDGQRPGVRVSEVI